MFVNVLVIFFCRFSRPISRRMILVPATVWWFISELCMFWTLENGLFPSWTSCPEKWPYFNQELERREPRLPWKCCSLFVKVQRKATTVRVSFCFGNLEFKYGDSMVTKPQCFGFFSSGFKKTQLPSTSHRLQHIVDLDSIDWSWF